MIKGTGIDITEIDRIESLLQSKPKFVKRILTDTEMEKFQQLSGHRKCEFLAGRFAAKEAFAKALGTGIGANLSFLDIEIGYEEKGKPCIVKPFSKGVHLSITHSKHYAFAQVIIEE
ncbi:holo-ACP synthase [Niallia sp. FSL R7-0648]|uniref:holo-ACP synthase n=1 Tax=Niallia sp. FSL R7-0648 TaxID=2954521 RepID=UPI0011A6A24F